MLNRRIITSDPGFPFVMSTRCSHFWSFTIDEADRVVVERDCVTYFIYLASLSWKCLVVAAYCPTLLEEKWAFPGEVELLSDSNACGLNGSFPGLTQQPGRAPYPRHLAQPSLFFNLLYSMCVLMSLWLSVCVLIAQLSQLTGIGKENFWKTRQ